MKRHKHKKHIKDLKKVILHYVKENKRSIAKSFTPPKSEQDMGKALIDTNWKHIEKYYPLSYNYEIVREFECKPYKGELRAYVYLTVDESIIENVIVQTE